MICSVRWMGWVNVHSRLLGGGGGGGGRASDMKMGGGGGRDKVLIGGSF